MVYRIVRSRSVVRFAIVVVVLASIFAAPCAYDSSSREASSLEGVSAIASLLFS